MNKQQLRWYYPSVFLVTFLIEIYWNGAISYYYIHQLGMEIKYQITIWSIFSVTMMFSCFFAGKNSDRSMRNGSRRLPYIKGFGIIAGLIFAITFTPIFATSSQVVLAFRFFISLILLDLSCQFVYTCLFAIPSEEVSEIKKRTVVYSNASMLQFIACIFITVVFPFIQPNEGDSGLLFSGAMITVGIICSIIFYMASKKLPSTYISNKVKIKNTSYIESLKQCLSNKKFLVAEVFLTSTIIASGFLTIGFYYFLDECVNGNMLVVILLIAGCFAGAGFMFFLSPKLVNRYGMYNVTTGIGLICATCLIVNFFLTQYSFAFFIGGIGTGISFVIQYYFNQLLMVMSVDEDVKKSGIRKEGEYFGLDSLFDCIGAMSQPLFLALLIYLGYQESLAIGAQNFSAEQGIYVAFLLAPGIIIAIASVIFKVCSYRIEVTSNALAEKH